MKYRICIFFFSALVFVFATSVKAQITPLFTNTNDNRIVDEATDRQFVDDVFFLPALEDGYTLNKNVRNWIKNFFNSNTGFILSQETEKDHRHIEMFYRLEFQKKTTPPKEIMGICAPLLYSNKNLVTYKAIFGHSLNGITYKVDIATFIRNTGNRMTIKDIFKCDDIIIKKLMFENRPKGYPCDLNSANDIRIVSAGINRNSIDVVGNIYKDNTTVFNIPFDKAEEYLTEEAYKMHGTMMKRQGTIFSEMEPVSWTSDLFVHLLKNNSLSYGKYHNTCLDKEFEVQIDKKYDFDRDGNLKSRSPKNRIYMEVPSDDENKEVYIEFSKSDAKSFIEELNDQLDDFKDWKKKMQSQQFAKYKLENNEDGKTNVSFYRKDSKTFGYEEDFEFVFQFVYYKTLGTTALVINSSKKDGVSKNIVNLASTYDKNINMGLMEDKLSGWTLILENPEMEIPDICKALQACVDNMK